MLAVLSSLMCRKLILLGGLHGQFSAASFHRVGDVVSRPQGVPQPRFSLHFGDDGNDNISLRFRED